MNRYFMLVILALLCAATFAQEYSLEVRSGVGDVVAPPFTQLEIGILRADTRPFVGRIVVDFSGVGPGPRRRGRGFGGSVDIVITQDVTLEESAASRVVKVDVPVTSSGFNPEIRLERQVNPDYYEVVARAQGASSYLLDQLEVVGFVSSSRLQMAQSYFHFRIVEIPVQQLPDSWKALTAFDAIIINDDRLSRAQSAALGDYLTAGGTVILSPGSASSFNPETLAGSLLRIPSTSESRSLKLNEFADLLQPPKPSGGLATHNDMATPDAPTSEQSPDAEESVIQMPSGEARITLWQDSGRAKPTPEHPQLVSTARVGAGNLIFLHTDISSAPLVTGEGMPTMASANLLNFAHASARGRTGRSPISLLSEKDVRHAIDIAGRRIPGRDALIILLLVYIAMASVGMFLVARKLRKPELYPATLFVSALISVGLVFGLGELYKRSGNRVKSVRVLVSDETTQRNALFSLGCAYAVDGETYRFVNDRSTVMIPARLESPRLSTGLMPIDPFPFTTNFTAGEAHTEVQDIDRWQNVFFLQGAPSDLEGFSLRVEDTSGAFKVANLSPHELRACVFVVGKRDFAPDEPTCDWHFAPTLTPKGGAESEVSFSKSTRLPNQVPVLAQHVRDVVDDDAAEVLGGMFNINEDDRIGMAYDLQQLERTLGQSGLLPEGGEFLFLCVLPEGAISASSIGASDVEPDDLSQINLWIIRGAVREAR